MSPQEDLNGFVGYRKDRSSIPPRRRTPASFQLPLAAAAVALMLGLATGYVLFSSQSSEQDGKTPASTSPGPSVALIAPVSGTTTTEPPILYWSGDSEATHTYSLTYLHEGGTSEKVTSLTDTHYALPQLEPGTYTWQLTIQDAIGTNQSEVWTFTLEAEDDLPPTVQLLGPADLEQMYTAPQLFWSQSDPEGQALTTTLTYGPASLEVQDVTPGHQLHSLQPGTYDWYITVSDGTNAPVISDTWSFTILPPVDTPPELELLLPENGGEEDDVTLVWSGFDPQQQSVTFEVYLDETDATTLATSTNDMLYQPVGLVQGTTYFWKVVAHDGTLSTTSPVWSFTVSEPVDEQPELELLFPEDGENLLEVTLVWSGRDPEGQPLTFEVYLDDEDATTLVETTTEQRYTPQDLELSVTYHWKIVAEEGDHRVTSPVWSFTPEPMPETNLFEEVDYEAAEEAVNSNPLSEPVDPGSINREEQISVAQQEQQESTPDTEGSNFTNSEDPDPNAPGVTEDDLPAADTEPSDLSEPRHGPSSGHQSEYEEEQLQQNLEGFPQDDSAQLEGGYDQQFKDSFSDPFDEGEGRGNLFQVRVLTSGDVYDNNSDGNPEFVRLFSVAYGALGNDTAPEYESLYISHLMVRDNNSDGHANLISLTEFGFESYDGDQDGSPEYASAYLRYVMAYDNRTANGSLESDGKMEHVSAFAADYVMVDVDGNGINEFQAGHFQGFELYDNNSDGHAEYLEAGEWTFWAVDKDNDTHPELAASWVTHVSYRDNNSDGNPEYADFLEFGYGHIDLDDDGEAGFEMLALNHLQLEDPNSTGNASKLHFGKVVFMHSLENGNFTLVDATILDLTDNNTDGHPEHISLVRWAFIGVDKDNDGNHEFTAVESSGVSIYDNMSNGNFTHFSVYSLKAWTNDTDDDGENETVHVKVEYYFRRDDEGDGTIEEEVHIKYDSDDEQ